MIFFLQHKSQTDINKILQSPGTYILLPGRLNKYNAWANTTETNYQNKNTKREKEGKKKR